MKLIKLSKKHEVMYIDYINSWNEPIIPTATYLEGYSYEQMLEYWSKRETAPAADKVATSVYFLTDEEEQILYGVISIRLETNERVENYSGHIGYGINPKYRRQGYGNKILQLGLDFCKSSNMKFVYMTCRRSNVGSKSVILKNGGYTDITPSVPNDMYRFKINLR